MDIVRCSTAVPSLPHPAQVLHERAPPLQQATCQRAAGAGPSAPRLAAALAQRAACGGLSGQTEGRVPEGAAKGAVSWDAERVEVIFLQSADKGQVLLSRRQAGRQTGTQQGRGASGCPPVSEARRL